MKALAWLGPGYCICAQQYFFFFLVAEADATLTIKNESLSLKAIQMSSGSSFSLCDYPKHSRQLSWPLSLITRSTELVRKLEIQLIFLHVFSNLQGGLQITECTQLHLYKSFFADLETLDELDCFRVSASCLSVLIKPFGFSSASPNCCHSNRQWYIKGLYILYTKKNKLFEEFLLGRRCHI